MGSTGEELLTIDEVAEACNVSRSTVYRWIEAGLLPTTRLPRGRSTAIRIRWEDLVHLIEDGGTDE